MAVFVVFFACTAPNFGVTGTVPPPSTSCVANGATSGSSDSMVSASSDAWPGK